jgi:hypothetical protein
MWVKGRSLGYKSSNDRAILQVLKFIGFVDASGIPQDFWRQYRNKTGAPSVLAAAIRHAYSDLFAVYPDAYDKNPATLRDYFSARTDVGERALQGIVGTFKTLCEAARFDSDAPPQSATGPQDETAPSTKGSDTSHMQIHFNIQVHLPGDVEAEQYDAIFRSIAKHLLGKADA